MIFNTKTFLGITAIIGCVLLTWLAFDQNFKKSKILSLIEKSHLKDLNTLSSEKESDSNRAVALIRVANFNFEEVETHIEKFLNSDSEELRSAAVRILSNKDNPKNILVLRKSLLDKSRKVRLAAFKSMSKIKSIDVAPLLEKQLDRNALPLEEKLAIKESLYFIYQDQNKKQAILDEFIFLLDTKNPLERHQTIMKLISMAPDNPIFLNKLRETIYQKENSIITPQAILHLSKQKDPWITENINFYLANSDQQVRLSALAGLPYSCPPNIWQLLFDYLSNEKSEANVKSVFSIIRSLDLDSSKKFLARLIKLKTLPEMHSRLAHETSAHINGWSKREPTCPIKME